jgi:DNA-directed RNA polymerase specialized sigma24 family protein
VEAVVLQGQTLRTVAERLGISAATVHRVLHQGLAELRRQLSPASGAPGC